MTRQELIRELKKFNLNEEDYVLTSSSALLISGIIEEAGGDINICVSESKFNELRRKYDINIITKKSEEGEYDIFCLGERINIYIKDLMFTEKQKCGNYYIRLIYVIYTIIKNHNSTSKNNYLKAIEENNFNKMFTKEVKMNMGNYVYFQDILPVNLFKIFFKINNYFVESNVYDARIGISLIPLSRIIELVFYVAEGPYIKEIEQHFYKSIILGDFYENAKFYNALRNDLLLCKKLYEMFKEEKLDFMEDLKSFIDKTEIEI